VGLLAGLTRFGILGEISLAMDSDPFVLGIYAKNVRGAKVSHARVEEQFNGKLGVGPTKEELVLVRSLKRVHVLMGGPPCQGHSDLNNHTRRNDPKNALYLRMARAAEVLRPKVVIVENVPPVRRDRSGVVESTCEALRAIGYRVVDRVVDL